MTGARRVLLDTSIAIAHFRQDGLIGDELRSYPLIYLPAIALGELYHGAYKSDYRRKHLDQLAAFLAAVLVLDVDAVTAEHYGQSGLRWPRLELQSRRTIFGSLRSPGSTNCPLRIETTTSPWYPV